MSNPEWSAMNSIDRRRERRIELSPTMVRAHERAQAEVLKNPDYVIQEKDFASMYGAEAVEREIAEADYLAQKFESRMTQQDSNTKKIADTFEAMVLMQSEINEWLGSNASTLKTARYDDYFNKVDMIAEWKTPGEGHRVLALAVDVTFGLKSIEKKLVEIRQEIERGQLGSLRYFRDEGGNIMGMRHNLARTVVGISQPVIEELASLWMENKNKQLGEHPIQRTLVDQIRFQLSMMQQYALKLEKYEVAQAYEQALKGMERVRDEKKYMQVGDLTNDPVRLEIVEQTKSVFSTR